MSPGNISATSAGYNGIGTPPMVSPEKEVGRVLTVTELALKIIPILNTLKAEMASIQLAIRELPSLVLALKELKKGFLELQRKSAVFNIKVVQIDLALKSLNKSSLAYEFSKIPLEVRKPPSILKMPTRVVSSSNDVMVGPVSRAPNTVVSPPSDDLSMLDFNDLFQ